MKIVPPRSSQPNRAEINMTLLNLFKVNMIVNHLKITSLVCIIAVAGGKSPPTPASKRKQQNSTLPPPAALTKSRSHESQLSVRPDASDLRYV